MTTQEIILKAAKESEDYLKNRVRERLQQKPKLKGFSSGMGTHFFSFINGEIDSDRKAPNTQEILEEFDLHLDSFGSFPWRIDWIDGKYIERTDW